MFRKTSTAVAITLIAVALFSAVLDVQLQPLAEAARRFYVNSVSAGDSSIIVAGTSADPTVAVAAGGITTDKLADGAVTPAKVSGQFVNTVAAGDGSIAIGGNAANPTVAVSSEGLGNAHFADEALSPAKVAKPMTRRVALVPAAVGVPGWQDVSGITLSFNSLGRPLSFTCQASVVGISPMTVDFRVVLDGATALQTVRTTVNGSDFRAVHLSDVVESPSAGAHTLKLQAMMGAAGAVMFTQPASCAVIEH